MKNQFLTLATCALLLLAAGCKNNEPQQPLALAVGSMSVVGIKQAAHPKMSRLLYEITDVSLPPGEPNVRSNGCW